MENEVLSSIFELIKFIVILIFVGGFMWYFFRKYTQAEEKRIATVSSSSKPVRFQAYERMAMLLERISPVTLVCRVQPYNDSVQDYIRLLMDHINQEFEYNVTQQMYISDTSWQKVKEASRSCSELIETAVKEYKVQSVEDVKTAVLEYCASHPSPTDEAISYLKRELREMF